MKQFGNVLRELRIWLMGFSITTKIMPYRLYIMAGGLGCSLICEFISLVRYFSFLNILSTAGHYGFLLGFWLVIISQDIKWAPYGLFTKAMILLFPFTTFYLSTIVGATIYAYFGYYLLKYTAVTAEYQ